MAEERLNGLDYTAQSWNVGDPITQSRMMNIENAIETAFYRLGVKADTGGYGGSLQNLYTTLDRAITEVRNTANQAANDVSTATQNTMDGQHAWAALTGAGVIYDTHNGTFNPSLANILLGKADQTDLATEKERIDSIIATIGESGDNPTGLNKRISDITSSITAINTNINGAKDPNVVNDTLGARFDRIEGRISVNTGAIDTLNNSSGNNYATLAERLAAIDNNQLGGEPDGFRTLPAVDSELKAARGKDANDNDYATLSARLGANDTKVANVKATADNAVPKANIVHDLIHNGTYEVLGADQGAVITNNIATAKSEAIASANTYADTKIADTKIADNLTTDTPGYVLGAGQGKALNTRLSNAEAEIAAAHVSSVIRTNDAPTTFSNGIDERFENIEGIGVAAKNEIEDAHRTDLGVDETTGLPIQDTLRTRFEAIESAAAASDNAIDGRLDALEDNVNGAKVQDGPQTLDARFDAVESRATQLETNVNTIANELSMVNTQTNAIQDTNSRIDTIEENVVAIGKEIGMLQDLDAVTDLSTAVSRNDTDIDKIKSELNDARIQIGTDENEDPIMGTLDDRFDANESDIAAINAKIGGNYDSTNTVTAAITAAITAAEAYTDTQNTTNKVTQIAEANREHSGHFVEDEETHEQVEVADTLDLRFDDIEGRLDAIDTPSTGAIAGLTGRIGALETSIDTQTTGLKDRMIAAETAINHVKDETDANDKGGLEQRMDAAEAAITTKASQGDLTALSNTVGQISTTIVLTKAEVNFNNDNEPTTFVNGNIIDKNDYLIQSPVDDKYYYWKHIDGNWHLMGGAGGDGTGNTSGFDLTHQQYVAIANTQEGYQQNTDYYVTEDDGFVHHYRYVMLNNILTEIEIGTVINKNRVKQYNVSKIYDSEAKKNYLRLYEYNYGEQNIIENELEALDWTPNTPYVVDNLVLHDNYIYKCTTANNDAEWTVANWEQVSDVRIVTTIELPEGGGGQSSTSVNRLVRIGNQAVQTIVNSQILLRVFYSSWDENESNDGTYTLKLGDNTIKTGTFNSGAKDETIDGWKDQTDGYYEFDVTNYCKVGGNSFTLTVNVNGSSLGKTWNINIIDLRIESSAPDNLLISTENNYSFQYTPYGALTKTLHVLVDNQEIGTQTLLSTASGRSNNYAIPAQSHGAHTVKLYLTATVGNTSQTTDPIIREYIWYDANNTSTPVILASKYNGQTINTQQYSTVEIPYQVYKKDATSIDVYYYLDNAAEPFDHVTLEGTNVGTLSYLASTASSKNQNDEYVPHTLTIKVDNISITTSLIVTPLDIDVSPVNGAIIDFDPTSLTNSSSNRLPSWVDGNETYRLTVSDNFNWSDDISGGGYKEDKDGKCFIIKAGSYADLNYPMFKRVNGQTVLDRGAEMKIVFKVAAVRDVEATWFTNTGILTNKTVGIQLNAHNGWLKTDQATDKDTKDTQEEYPTWEENHEYAVDDVVVTKNVIYKCIKADTNFTIIVPTDASVTKYWSQLTLATWISGTEYKANNAVTYDNVNYICIKDIPEEDRAITPDTEDNEYWTEFEDTAWTSGTEYLTGSIVIYNGNYYLAAKDVINELALNPKNNGNWLKMGATESEILATNSYLYFPYSEEDKIELDININAHQQGTDNNFIMSYEDGVPSKAYAYTYGVSGDSIYHDNTIRIGSPDCDVYIYRLRIYKSALETADILQNFIADGKDINEKVTRYNRNCIYWDPTQNDGQGAYLTTPTGTATLDPVKLAERVPNVKILMLDTPVFTVGKKNFVQGSTLRCIHAAAPQDYTGDLPYPTRGDADNWFFQNGFHAGQGTTSDNYGQSARNVDFLFIADEHQHYPTKAKNMKGYDPKTANYVSSVLVGRNASRWVEDETTHDYHWVPAENATPDRCVDWKGDDCKVSLTATSVPNNYFNLKVNVASSENVNNALFQQRYNNFLVYNSPAHDAQIAKHGAAYRAMGLDTDKMKVKNGMEFVPAILFVRENDPDLTKHTEFNDTKWHFYALGNIGDSKKTDYTRAYDPDDMNEFTVENSDNNTNNGQFQSGVFMYNNQKAVETDYNEWDNTKAYKQYEIIVKDGKMYQRVGADMAEIAEGTTASWVAADWNDITPTTTKTIYYAPRTNPNPMDYLYGIDVEEWNTRMTIPDSDGVYHYINRKHDTLVTEEFDGDHSFEFRYACCGDYRDGDLINDTTGTAKKQFNLNHDTVLAFYEWLVTSTDAQYRAEAEEWIVPSAMEFFYAFTHYYTMMDNRAKNTFWHFAKTGKYREVSRPVPELLHVYEVAEGNVTKDTNGICTGTFSPTEDETINPEHTYYTQYAFDLWVYDCDTAAGIDNNGALVFPYGKEDEDYRVEGESSSGYAFNGAGSIFWRRLKKTFANEIAEVMNNADAACFNSENLINQFDEFQNCFPEEIWRLDIERKYIRTFTGVDTQHPYDNAVSVGKQNPRFLTSMMQGRKKYQRRQWIRDQGVYFNSKYRLTDIIKNDNTIEFNVITPTNANSLAVPPSYMLELTPYQDMYLNVQVGNGNYQEQKRAKAGKKYTYNLAEHTSGTFQETRIYINGANHLSKIGNLAPMYIYGTDFRALAHLKELDIGTNETGFTNANLTELNFSSNVPLLEKLNIKNCHSLAKPINLRTANNIREVDAEGTAITGITLPDYTSIEVLHLPSTVIAVHLYGARFLKDFKIYNNSGVEDYDNLYTLDIYDSDYSANFKENPSDPLPVDWINIATEMLVKQSAETSISLLKLTSATINNIDELSPLANMKDEIEENGGKLDVGGMITVTGNWSAIEKTTYENLWQANNLNLVVNENNEVTRYKVTYKLPNDVDNGRELYTVYLTPAEGQTIVSLGSDPAYVGTISSSQLVKPSTVSTEYIFGQRNSYGYMAWTGWRKSTSAAPVGNNTNIDGDTILIAIFNEKTRSYPIHWYLRENDNTPVRISDNILYGGSYVGVAPTVYDLKSANKATYTTGFTASNTKFYYSIFEGWDRLPINLDSTCLDLDKGAFCIYGRWTGVDQEHAVLVSDVLAQETFTPEKLLLLSILQDNVLSGETPYVNVGDTLDLTLGYDSIEPGTLLIGEDSHYIMNNARIYDPTVSFSSINNPPPFSSNIVPFSEDNGFTLAIDYRFDKTAISSMNWSNGFSVLAGCYEKINGVSQGFSLYYDVSTGVPRVCFGDQSEVDTFTSLTSSCAVGNDGSSDARNIIVLRHPKNSNTIEVYSGIYSSNNILPSLDDAFFVQELTWSSNTSAAKLCFGNLVPDGTATPLAALIRQGLGTIYWAKYWNKDLGQSECTQLASWPHEKIRFAIEDYPNLEDNESTQDYVEGKIINTSSKNIFFTALQVSQYGGPSYSQNQRGGQLGEIQSWEGSLYKNISNKRFFLGLPTAIQSIINKTEGYASAVICRKDQNDFNSKYVYYTDYPTTDYAFLPTYPEVTGSTGTYYESEAYRRLPWYSAGNTKVISYVNTNFNVNNSTTDVSYMNLRFPGVPINLGLGANTVYVNYTGNDPVYNKIGSTKIKRGDIFIYQNVAYIYASDEDVRNGAPIINASSGVFACEAGGWVRSKPWWTRTVMEMNPATSYNSFYFINGTNGQVSTGAPIDNSDSGIFGAWFVYTFGI